MAESTSPTSTNSDPPSPVRAETTAANQQGTTTPTSQTTTGTTTPNVAGLMTATGPTMSATAAGRNLFRMFVNPTANTTTSNAIGSNTTGTTTGTTAGIAAGTATGNTTAANVITGRTPIVTIPPNVGGIDQHGPWVGGEPFDLYWTASKNSRPRSVYCYRSGKDIRQYQSRIKGVDTKFQKESKDGYNLHAFTNDVQEHLELHGMDSIFYTLNSDKQLVNIIQNHNLLTTENVIESVKDYKLYGNYDYFDLDNLADSKVFLLNSIDPLMKLTITPFVTPDTTGPEIWMRIVSEIQSSSVERLVQVANDVKKLRLKDYKGEDVKTYSLAMMALCQDLQSGQSLPRDICLTIIDHLIECSVEKFRMDFLTIRREVLDQLRKYHGKSNDVICNLQRTNNYHTYDSLLETANISYNHLVDMKQWGPAVNTKDKHGAPETLVTAAEANALVQKAISKFKKNFTTTGSGNNNNVDDKDVTCFTCKKKGHRKSDCPQNKGKGKSNNNHFNWKTKAPKSGEPQTKSVEGKEWHWCAKCGDSGRWSPTHGTNEHKMDFVPANKPKFEANTAGLYCNWTETNSSEVLLSPDTTYFNNIITYLLFPWLFFTWVNNVIYQNIIFIFSTGITMGTIIFVFLFQGSKNTNTNSKQYSSWKFTKQRKRNKNGIQSSPIFHLETHPVRLFILSALQIPMYTYNFLFGKPPNKDFKRNEDKSIRNKKKNKADLEKAKYQKQRKIDLEKENKTKRQLTNKITSPFYNNNKHQWTYKLPHNNIKQFKARFPNIQQPDNNVATVWSGQKYLNDINKFSAKQRKRIYDFDVSDVYKHINLDAKHNNYDKFKQTVNNHNVKYHSEENNPTNDTHNVNNINHAFPSNEIIPLMKTYFDSLKLQETPNTIPDTTTNIVKEAENVDVDTTIQTMLLNDTLLSLVDFAEPICMINELTEIVSNMFPTKQCETHEVLWDTGATLSVSAHKEDFIGVITPTATKQVMKGIAKGLNISGMGEIAYKLLMDDNSTVTITTPAYYVPLANRRIFSPQAYFQNTGKSCGSTQNHEGITLLVGDKEKKIPYNTINNLPTFYAHNLDLPHLDATAQVCVSDDDNQNLSAAQKELLRWHFRLGHLNFNSVQLVLKSGNVGDSSIIKSASKCEHPKCASCRFGKAKRRPSQYQATKIPLNPHSIRANDLRAGQQVSIDHFSVTQKGRLFDSYGKTSSENLYTGGCIFYDHGSEYISTQFHVHQNAIESIEAKQRYEKEMFDYGVVVQSYHTDNGIFSAAEYLKEINYKQQQIRFSGSGAHHQNGIAERAIGTIFSIARTMLIHAAIRWPDVIEPDVWPMAISYAVWLYNNMPKSNGIAPIELVVRSKNPTHVLVNAHVFGSPAYVLDPKLQGLSKLPKFSPRSRRGMFVGFSQQHSSTVPLILNLSTLSITPQFHVVFDDWFTTVNSSSPTDIIDEKFHTLFSDSRYQYSFDEFDDVVLNEEWNTTPPSSDTTFDINDQRENIVLAPVPTTTTDQNLITNIKVPVPITTNIPADVTIKQSTTPILPPPLLKTQQLPPTASPTSPAITPAPPTISSPTITSPTTTNQLSPIKPSIILSTKQVQIKDPQPIVRRSTRPHQVTRRYGFNDIQAKSSEAISCQRENTNILLNHVINKMNNPNICNAAVYVMSCNISYEDNLIEYHDPSIYMQINNKVDDNGTLNFHQAIYAPDWDQFQLSAIKEIQTLENMNTWIEMDRTEVPEGHKILGGTWVFKRKKAPDGTIIKHKARYCVRGDQQVHGVDYFESYAPVCMWSTVRLCLVLSIVADLASIQVDYTNAFAQAALHEEVYIQVPTGFTAANPTINTVLKLQKSLYGLVQAPRTFYEFLTGNLKDCGFECCVNVDPCLWIHKVKKIICVIWVDDCLFFAKTKDIILHFIEEIKQVMPLTVETTVTAFLGIQVKRDKEKYELTQPGLIQQIINATDMKDCNATKTPASTTPTSADVNGEPFDEIWAYASIVGMLMFLANNSRPDIAYATHQCARFTHAPKKSHALAVKKIVRYLQGTKDKGLYIKPSQTFSIDCYVDADFAGLFGHEDSQTAVSVKSRTGYVLLLADCPLLWVSKLQTMVASSTMESEYIALSTAMRDLIPMRRLLTLVCDTIFGVKNYKVKIHSSVFEDNNGALQLARAPRMTPRTKHYGIKYHFFREHVSNGDIQLFKVDTKEQRADIFTKGLLSTIFEHIRGLLMGW